MLKSYFKECWCIVSACDLKNSRELFFAVNNELHVRVENKLTCCEAHDCGFREAVRYGGRGFCGGVGVLPGSSTCFVFLLRACLRLFFCVELLMRIFFWVWDIEIEYHFECIFVYSVKFLLRFIVWIMTWTIWSTCTFGHELKWDFALNTIINSILER